MSRNYGSLGRRSGNTAWQWIIIGSVLGFGCSVILVLGLLAFGVLNLSGQSIANLPSQTPFIITATAAPVTPTTAPTESLETEEAAIVLAPTASPTIDPTQLTPLPTATVPTPTVLGFGSTPQLPTQAQTSSIGQPNTVQSLGVEDRFEAVLAGASPLVAIDGGTFQMGTTTVEITAAVQECLQGYGGDPGACDMNMAGDSLPAHNVTISPFSIESTEVTYQQYLNFLNTLGPGSHRNGCFQNPCAQTNNDSETSNILFEDSVTYTVNAAIPNFPVANVTWYGAQAYCQAIGRRLPTEAEWERAARGPNGSIYPWGNNDWNGANAATRRDANGQPVLAQPVDAFPGGAVVWSGGSVLNMAGNVAEWVFDWYDDNYYDSALAAGPDPQGPSTGTQKVNRGGSWDTMPFFARAVHRRERNPNEPTADIGFRCVADASGTTRTGDGPIGSDPLPVNTVDPAGLGIPEGGTNEETTGSSQATLPPAPTRQTTPTLLPTQGVVGTLESG